MQRIKKFQVGRNYYSNLSCKLYHILSRSGMELKVARISQNKKDVFTVTASYAADANDAYEFFLYEDARVPSTNLLPIGRRVSELPAEEQAVINDAVRRDVEYRKSKRLLDRPDIETVHKADGTIVHRIIDDHIIEK